MLDYVINELPDPVLTQVCSVKAVVGPAVDVGDPESGQQRGVSLVGGVLTGPELNGTLLPGGTASWQFLPDGTARAEIHYTLQTDRGLLLDVHSSGVGGGEAGERLFHTSTHIRTDDPELDWLNRAVLITVVGRTAVNMLYETYMVG